MVDMALFHRATLSPTKAELIAEWAPAQAWGPPSTEPMRVIGSYRFDDPDGRVGMETHLVEAGGVTFQVPLTYRDEPLDGAGDALITEMEHSVLGTRWVYDGLRDPGFVVMLAAVTMTGQGEALGMAVSDGRWFIAPSNVRIHGGGWTIEARPRRRLHARRSGRARRRAAQRPLRADVLPPAGARPPTGDRVDRDLGGADGPRGPRSRP